MAIPPALRDTQFNCTPGGGSPECPDCGPSPILSLACCPLNGSCILTCDTPVLIQACGGTPPYTFEGDSDFLTVTPVDVDKALITLRKNFFQFVYTLRCEVSTTSSGICGVLTDHPGAAIIDMFIKQKNKVYDCDMNLLPSDDFNDLNMKFDAFRCCACACIDDADIPSNVCQEDLGLVLPLLGGGTLCAFLRTDAIKFGRVFSSLGLDVSLTMNGSQSTGTTVEHATGVFGEIPRGPIDVFVTDAVFNSVSIPIA